MNYWWIADLGSEDKIRGLAHVYLLVIPSERAVKIGKARSFISRSKQLGLHGRFCRNKTTSFLMPEQASYQFEKVLHVLNLHNRISGSDLNSIACQVKSGKSEWFRQDSYLEILAIAQFTALRLGYLQTFIDQDYTNDGQDEFLVFLAGIPNLLDPAYSWPEPLHTKELEKKKYLWIKSSDNGLHLSPG